MNNQELCLHVLSIDQRLITIMSGKFIVQNGINVDAIKIDFDSEWDGLTKQVILSNGVDDPKRFVYEPPYLKIPSALIDEDGSKLEVSVLGYKGSELRMVTAKMLNRLKVVKSGSVDAGEVEDDVKDIWGDIQDALGKVTGYETEIDQAKQDITEALSKVDSLVETMQGSIQSSKNILESVKAQKADVDSTIQQFKADATEYDTKFNGYVSEAKESKEASAASATSASESAENASTSATNASASATNANASADAAALSATNAANSAKEAADNLSLLGASTLTRKEKDTFVHVDDAFPTKLLGIEIEGACKQDGTPSPDNPVPIQVVENPVVKLTGKNLWPFASSYTSILGHQNEFVEDKTPFTIPPGTYTFSAAGSLGNTDAPLFGYTATGKRIELFRILRNVQNPKYSFTVTEPIISIYFISNAADSSNGTISNIQLELDSIATEYKPYTLQQQAFTLPAEHPYLAKVDNKADEIRVDRDGNVELVARVGVDKNVRKVDAFQRGEYYSFNTNLSPFASYNEDYGGIMLCSTLQSRFLTSNGDGIYRTWNGVYVKDTSGRTKEEIQAEVDKNAPLTVVAKIPEKRYPLGKIEIPKAQDSIVNAWTDAEVTPRTGIEYVRDANIVVSNLEQAIASITQG